MRCCVGYQRVGLVDLFLQLAKQCKAGQWMSTSGGVL